MARTKWGKMPVLQSAASDVPSQKLSMNLIFEQASILVGPSITAERRTSLSTVKREGLCIHRLFQVFHLLFRNKKTLCLPAFSTSIRRIRVSPSFALLATDSRELVRKTRRSETNGTGSSGIEIRDRNQKSPPKRYKKADEGNEFFLQNQESLSSLSLNLIFSSVDRNALLFLFNSLFGTPRPIRLK